MLTNPHNAMLDK